jgi:hypothetical protein
MVEKAWRVGPSPAGATSSEAWPQTGVIYPRMVEPPYNDYIEAFIRAHYNSFFRASIRADFSSYKGVSKRAHYNGYIEAFIRAHYNG